MGVYIQGLEMPKKTYAHCMLIKDIDGSVQLHVCTKNSEEISEWEVYDLVPVPPHGRLVEADELFNDICNSLNEMTAIGVAVDGEWMWGKLNDALRNALTVIEAEEGE